MRVADRPLPPIALDAVPAIAGWPIRPVLAIAHTRDVEIYDAVPVEVYDDPVPPGVEYDADAVPGFIDATCEWQGLATEAGGPDEHGNMPASRLVCQIDNASGAWSRYNVNGAPAGQGPGYELLLWATDGVTAWWLFAGRIARWDVRADNTVEIEAFDGFSDLAQPVGPYTPGVAGQTAGPRLEAVLTSAGKTSLRHRFATGGPAALTAQPSTRAPLEEAQVVAGSDGGRLYGDADGTVVYADRTWRNGRTDQTVVPVITGNVCTAPLTVWEPLLSVNDDALADTVVLTNVAGLRAQSPAGTLGHLVYTDTAQQWTTQTEGDSLAAELLGAQNTPLVSLDSFNVYLLDANQPAAVGAADWRLFDRLRFVQDTPAVGGTLRLDLTVLVAAVAHQITPDGWLATYATTRPVGYAVGLVWDTAAYVWNDANPLAVWGY